MAAVPQAARNMAESADRDALQHEEEAVEVASQWAQEKLENFLTNVENNGNDHKLLKISYIISRRTSIDVFSAKSSDLGEFVKQIIGKLADGKVMEGIAGMAGTVINKLFGSASGSAQTERFYEVTFDELGGLNRVDAFFFCYRFASSGLTNFSKAVIGTCIVRSAASMVDDNAYRVVLTSSATLSDDSRKKIAESMVGVAKFQHATLSEVGVSVPTDPALLEARAILAGVIGEGVASSEQYVSRRNARTPFKMADTNGSAESQADKLAARTSTLAMDDKPGVKQIDAVGA
ncbi:hypothetical protein G6011_10111 [Alternaria panax]|uniref:Uncharacterized protein n=1 Tax=Alternaria panax TaxID=48097 RepID=A0AAD4I607_9PLEO|nr:hypothetical protein G6011_10111 [Alternaria panax]